MPSIKDRAIAIRNALIPSWGGLTDQVNGRSDLKQVSKNLSRFISPVQLARIKQDIQTWRDSMTEAENAWYPQRVKMQRMYLDTVLNGHVFACMDRREKLTTLKKFRVVDKKTRKEDPEKTKIFKAKWFRQFMKYQIESKAFGYSLIYLDDLVDDAFPKLSIIRRFNISPDRLNVTQFIYSISGAPFLEQPYADWHIWVDTPTDVGVSSCGYGYLYKVAMYEIYARNVLTQNIDATELYGMPMRVGKTNKSAESEERAVFEQALAEMGSAGYILLDLAGDEVELVESKSLGQGYKIYESLEKRVEAKISKIILGHADAMDSTPGKLGSDTEESPAQKALRDTATVDMEDLTDCTNNQLMPHMIKLGFNLTENDEWEFINDEEEKEAESEENDNNEQVATIFQLIKQAGGDPDWKYFSKRTGITVTPTPIPTPPAPIAPGAKDKNEDDDKPDDNNKTPDKVKAKLDRFYGGRKEKEKRNA